VWLGGAVLVPGVQLCDEDGRLEADGAHARAILEVPEHALPVLAGAEQEAIVGGPAQRLDLARVAAQFAGDAIGLDVEDDDDAVVLRALADALGGDAAAYASRGQQVAAVAEADRRRVAAACAESVDERHRGAGGDARRRPVMTSGQSWARTKGSTSERFMAAGWGRRETARAFSALHRRRRRAPCLCVGAERGLAARCSLLDAAHDRARLAHSRSAAPAVAVALAAAGVARLGLVVRRFLLFSAAWHACTLAPAPPPSPPPLHQSSDRRGACERVNHRAAPVSAPATAQKTRAARRSDARPTASPRPLSLCPRALFFDRIPPRAPAHQRHRACPWHTLSHISRHVSATEEAPAPAWPPRPFPHPRLLQQPAAARVAR
jgi:hypothetical protein